MEEIEKNISHFVNETNATKSIDHYFYTGEFIMSSIITSICLLSIGFLVVNIVILSNRQFKEKLFVYLKLESIYMCLNMIVAAIFPFYYSTYSKSFLANVYMLLGQIYATSFLEMCALLSGILASFCCLIFVYYPNNGRACRLVNGLNPYMMSAILTLACSALFSYELFQFRINREDVNEQNFYTKKYDSTVYDVLQSLTYFIRDCLCLITLLAVNLFMTIKARKSLKMKAKIMKYTLSKRDNSTGAVTTNHKRSHNKLMKMLLFDSLLYTFSRLPVAIYYGFLNIVLDFHSIFFELTLSIFIVVSYGLKFFLYFHFNTKFRSLFKSYVNSIREFIHRVVS